MGLLLIPLLTISLYSFAVEKAFCIQAVSSKELSPIVALFTKVQSFPNARIEKIGDYYVIRVGSWRDREEAVNYLPRVQSEFPDAFLRTCYLIKDRVVYPKKQSASQDRKYPELVKLSYIKVKGANEEEKICNAIMDTFAKLLENSYKINEVRTLSFRSSFPYSVVDALVEAIVLHRRERFLPMECEVVKKGSLYNLTLRGVKTRRKLNVVGVDINGMSLQDRELVIPLVYSQ